MKIQQFIKSLNNTEIGKGNTNECYVRVPTNCPEIQKIFDLANRRPTFIDKKTGSKIESIHITDNREFRINGLGDYYRDNNANAGDKILFERIDNNGKTTFYLDISNVIDSINFQKKSRGFEVLNIDRLDLLLSANRYQDTVIYNGSSGLFEIEFKESARKRSDSPDETDFYSISFNGQDILNDLRSNEYLELSKSRTEKNLKKVVVWQSYEFNL